MKHLTIVIKPTYSCNARCTYCDYPKKGEKIKPMTEETFSLLVRRLEEILEFNNGQMSFTLEWHGGEPLLMPNSFYEHVEKTVKESKLKYVSYTLQTNLILLDPEKHPAMIRLLGDRPSVGTSFDPVSDARSLLGNKSYKKEFIKRFFSLKGVVNTGGVIYVSHKGTIGREQEIYNYFKNLGFKSMNLNQASDDNYYEPRELNINPYEMGQVLINFWEAWEKDNRSINIKPFVYWDEQSKSDKVTPKMTRHSGSCSKNMYCIIPTGEVYHCDLDIHYGFQPAGSLAEDSFMELSKQKDFVQRSDKKIKTSYKEEFEKYKQLEQKPLTRDEALQEAGCAGCEWWNYCRGDCPRNAVFDQYNDLYGKSYWCESYKMLFNKVFKNKNVEEKILMEEAL